MTPTYEIQQLLYEVLDRLSRIERKLEIESEEVDLDGGLKFSIVENDVQEKVIEFPRPD